MIPLAAGVERRIGVYPANLSMPNKMSRFPGIGPNPYTCCPDIERHGKR